MKPLMKACQYLRCQKGGNNASMATALFENTECQLRRKEGPVKQGNLNSPSLLLKHVTDGEREFLQEHHLLFSHRIFTRGYMEEGRTSCVGGYSEI